MKTLTLALAIGVSGAAMFLALADPPLWWEGGAGTEDDVIDSTASGSNYGLANIGQGKWMAHRAHAAMEASLPGGAGFDLGKLFPPESITDNYGVLNLGQAKALAKPFYDKLISLGYDTRAGIEQSLFEDEHWTHAYPWNPSTPNSENYRPANIGQLKVVFGFDLGAALEASFRPIAWKDHVDITSNDVPGEGSALRKDSGTTGWNAGAISTGYLYGDGAIRFQAAAVGSEMILGLSDSNPDQGKTVD